MLVGAASPIPFEQYLRYWLPVHSERFQNHFPKDFNFLSALVHRKLSGRYSFHPHCSGSHTGYNNHESYSHGKDRREDKALLSENQSEKNQSFRYSCCSHFLFGHSKILQPYPDNSGTEEMCIRDRFIPSRWEKIFPAITKYRATIGGSMQAK